jgi:hypothetical protein
MSEGMLCSRAELGWDSSATDRVALLDASAGLQVGDYLDDRYVDWQRIVKTEDDLLGAGDSASSNRPKMPQLT